MGYSKKEARKAREKVVAGDAVATGTLDGTTTSEVIQLGVPAEKVTFQASGTLAGTIEFSTNGVDFYGSTAIPGSNAPGTYTTHMAKAVRVTRSGGEGKLHILAK